MNSAWNAPSSLTTALSRLAYQALSRSAGAVYALGPDAATRGLASLLGRLDGGSRECFRRNAEALAPDQGSGAHHGLGQRMQRARARAILEMLSAESSRGRWMRERTRMAGAEALHSALAGGRGAVMIWNHLGVWDAGARALVATGVRITAHADRPLGPLLWRGATHVRAREGLRLLPRAAGLGPLLAALRRGEVAAVSWDGHAGEPGDPALRGLWMAVGLARRSDAPLFRAACLPDPQGFQLHIEGPYPAPGSRAQADNLAGALAAAELELISRRAEHWGLRRTIEWQSHRLRESAEPCA